MLPWPAFDASSEAQLSVLWHRFQSSGSDRRGLVGAVDRVVAELYGLSLDVLMILERTRSLQTPLGL
ncbi:MAG: hypothetical protein ACOCV2_08420 [Persicimonas sp.]